MAQSRYQNSLSIFWCMKSLLGMFMFQSKESPETRFPDIQISAPVTIIKRSQLDFFFTTKSHSGWEVLKPLGFHCFLPHISICGHYFYHLLPFQILNCLRERMVTSFVIAIYSTNNIQQKFVSTSATEGCLFLQ